MRLRALFRSYFLLGGASDEWLEVMVGHPQRIKGVNLHLDKSRKQQNGNGADGEIAVG